MGINVLSLFDGISCGQVALERAGFNVDNYYASEIDRYAIDVALDNYPNTVQLGDVTKLDEEFLKQLPKIHMLIGGSPCQDISIAKRQNRNGLKGDKSKLFFEYMRVLEWIKMHNNTDVKFILENVKGSQEDIVAITEIIGVDPILIDSSMFSAQVRKRNYWTNIDVVTNPIKADEVKLTDVLEDGYTDREKSFCLTATYAGACVQNYFIKSERQLIFTEPVEVIKSKGVNTYKIGNEEIDIKPSKGADYNRENLNRLKKYVRKLTPIECERLQTLPDNYTKCVSNSQRYKSIGNGWTVDVVSYIFSFMK